MLSYPRKIITTSYRQGVCIRPVKFQINVRHKVSPLLCSASPGLSLTWMPCRPSSTRKPAFKAPAIRVPTIDRLKSIAADWNLQIEEKDIHDLRGCMGSAVDSYRRIDELTNSSTSSPFAPVAKFPRIPGGVRPEAKDNFCNAWFIKTNIENAYQANNTHGESKAKCIQSSFQILKGRTIACKDTIAVAGVPMMNGSRMLEGYTPEIEATIVTRVLEAGGIIAGKAVAEDLCCSGSSFATAHGPVRNPWNEEFSAGGSSSGCGALVGGGIVDMALGTDQGGSIRLPASWCGCVGLKPTFGLVPYTGVCSHEFTLDHAGPMARTVLDTALLLEAIAGLDPVRRDARQPLDMAPVPQYSGLATGEVSGMRIGLLLEGLENCEDDVRHHTMAAADMLRGAGARVEEVSIPLHRDSAAIWLPLCLEGGHATRMQGERGFRGYYPVSLQQAYFRGFHLQAAELSFTNKYYILFGEYVQKAYGAQYYQKCQNLVPALTQAYDELLANPSSGGAMDALLLPTTTTKPQLLPRADMTAAECITNAWSGLQNTAAFDLTGHPALSINAGFSEGPVQLPVGVQIVGRRWGDATVLNVARAIEMCRKPTPLPPSSIAANC